MSLPKFVDGAEVETPLKHDGVVDHSFFVEPSPPSTSQPGTRAGWYCVVATDHFISVFHEDELRLRPLARSAAKATGSYEAHPADVCSCTNNPETVTLYLNIPGHSGPRVVERAHLIEVA